MDVRTYKPGERGKEIRRGLFWPITIVLIGVFFALAAFIAPQWLGYDRDLENKMVTVTVQNAPDTRAHVIADLGNKEVSAKIPDMAFRKGESTKMLLEKLHDREHAKLYAGKFATIGNAQIQRVVSDDVIAVGSSPEDEIFVLVPLEARPSTSTDWGPQLDAKARINVSGILKLMPPFERAKDLLHLSKLKVETKPLPPLYLEATKVRVVANKPLFGSD